MQAVDRHSTNRKRAQTGIRSYAHFSAWVTTSWPSTREQAPCPNSFGYLKNGVITLVLREYLTRASCPSIKCEHFQLYSIR